MGTGVEPFAPPADEYIVWTSVGQKVLLAHLIDDVRQEIVDAWDRGVVPRYLIVEAPVWEKISAAKAREIERGNDVLLLGLIVKERGATDASRCIG